ncbi:hypothetical protein [Auritidibacter ignavus]|uniref:hypothetical protein n=1 Tax=Auritidibacter ignavus TaxID=678932 RepID=UPI00244C8EEF|nr:hypothetical protein [Auritidibacter ignavus]WGH83880.1 hypothetical protein QDX20_11600 [Auritidibacter ignavus]WGH86227.1 hypothetical protein QDX24_11890 [Auritidibacter ignavus]WGH88511.1 hypothetical protein QDX22_11890 [Auritidibacter ignavus]
MRTLFASIFALVIGIVTVIGLTGWRADALLHTAEPLREISGDEQVLDAVPALVADQVTSNAESQLPFSDALGGVTENFASLVVEDSRFAQAWGEAVEMTRQDWVEGLQQASTPAEPDAGYLSIHLTPVAQLAGVVLGEQLDQISLLDGVDPTGWVPSELVIDTQVPPSELISADDLVLIEQYVTYWPLVLGGAAMAFVLALLLAAPGARWSVWLISGAVIVLGGVTLRTGIGRLVDDSIAATVEDGTVAIVEPLMHAFANWSYPQLNVMMIGGAVVAGVGLIGALIAMGRETSSA